jgi:hypothetical protein
LGVEAPGARGQYEGEWRVGCSPKDGQGNWSYFQCELNIGSFVDAGYDDTINGNHATGGILIGATVPGAFGPPGSSKTATFAVATAGVPNNPSYAQFYNGRLINSDSIARGRGVQFGGANLAKNAPYAPFEVTRFWETGIRLEKENFRDGKAIMLSAQQKIAWDDGTQAVHLAPTEIRRLKRLLLKRKPPKKAKQKHATLRKRLLMNHCRRRVYGFRFVMERNFSFQLLAHLLTQKFLNTLDGN